MQDTIVYQDAKFQIVATDEKGAGGAYHEYSIWTKTGDFDYYDQKLCQISFQNGGMQEAGINGIHNEHLIAILMHRLRCFQDGPFPSEYNADAFEGLRTARLSLEARTRDRINRGVEGQSVA